MLEIFISVLVGCAAGIFAGLMPGIHPNTLAFLASSLAFQPLFPSSLCFISFMVAMAVSNSVISFIPSIFLGAPEEGTSLSVLPGHKLLMQGFGFHAIRLAVIGGLGAAVFCVSAMPIAIYALPFLYSASRPFLHIILSIAVAYMIFLERSRKKAMFCFGAAGLIGIIGNSLPISQEFYLFPVLSGLFGLPVLILSAGRNEKIPTQKRTVKFISKKSILHSVSKGSFAGLLVGILPGIGASQAAAIVNAAGRKKFSKESESFLITLGSVTIANTIFSLLALWIIGNPRSGVAVVIGNFVDISFGEFLLMISVSIVSCGIAALSTLGLAKIFSNAIQKINYGFVNKLVIALMIILVFYFTSFYGLLLLAVATSLGIYTNLVGVHRSQMMGVLLLPTILFFAGI